MNRTASSVPILEVPSVSKSSFHKPMRCNVLEFIFIVINAGYRNGAGVSPSEDAAVGGFAAFETLDGPVASDRPDSCDDGVTVKLPDGVRAGIGNTVVAVGAKTCDIRVVCEVDSPVDSGRALGQSAEVGVDRGQVGKARRDTGGVGTQIGLSEVASDDDLASGEPEGGEDGREENSEVLHCVDGRRAVITC